MRTFVHCILLRYRPSAIWWTTGNAGRHAKTLFCSRVEIAVRTGQTDGRTDGQTSRNTAVMRLIRTTIS